MKQIQVKTILATTPIFTSNKPLTLYTFQIDVPYYVWVELLTHKRIARNASSNRAISISKNIEELDFYLPPIFYKSNKGMKAGDPIEALSELDMQITGIWNEVAEFCAEKARELERLGVCKEQASRVLPTFKMMKGLVTGTYDAWMAFLELRDNLNADTAMQILAKKIREQIDTIIPIANKYHLPFMGDLPITETGIKTCAGRLARISYGKVEEKENDLLLGERLLVSKHLSPYEHIARWTEGAEFSAICSKEGDMDFQKPLDLNEPIVYGWENARSNFELLGNLKEFTGEVQNER